MSSFSVCYASGEGNSKEKDIAKEKNINDQTEGDGHHGRSEKTEPAD